MTLGLARRIQAQAPGLWAHLFLGKNANGAIAKNPRVFARAYTNLHASPFFVFHFYFYKIFFI
jgi:hypothetical protein